MLQKSFLHQDTASGEFDACDLFLFPQVADRFYLMISPLSVVAFLSRCFSREKYRMRSVSASALSINISQPAL